ncbi:hypothetical protein E2986_11056 [Frieseomelitta varia]|uniref:Uncharacterized protein n=1 Tax=Frieseomelitta varia TaxID=561572 RepID=A0A833RX80_9HYME|nr:hypothetical protein E2986_11056 [Frieseomelitta varia]
MCDLKEHSRHCKLETAITSRACQRLFEKFRSGDFLLKGRSSHIDDDVLRTTIEKKKNFIASDHIKKLGFVSKHDRPNDCVSIKSLNYADK